MNSLRVKTAISFASGSMIATFIFSTRTYEGFAVPCAMSVSLVWYVNSLLKAGETQSSPEPILSGPAPGHGSWFNPPTRTLQWAERDTN